MRNREREEGLRSAHEGGDKEMKMMKEKNGKEERR